MKRILPILLILLISSCLQRVDEEERIETDFPFGNVMDMNFINVHYTVKRTGSAESAISFKENQGTIKIEKQTITIEKQIDSANSNSMVATVRKCFIDKNSNGITDYKYKTDRGEFIVSIKNGEVFSITHEIGTDYKIYTK